MSLSPLFFAAFFFLVPLPLNFFFFFSQTRKSQADNLLSSQLKQPMMNLRRAEDIYFDAHILDVERDVAGNAITLLFDDGTFKTYDIKSFTPVNEDIDPLEVTSLANAGFYFPVTPEFPPVLHVAYSPSGCVAVGIDAETDVKMVYMMHDALKGLKDGEDGMGEGEVDEGMLMRFFYP